MDNETVPGGAYLDADLKGWHNANGEKIDPPTLVDEIETIVEEVKDVVEKETTKHKK